MKTYSPDCYADWCAIKFKINLEFDRVQKVYAKDLQILKGYGRRPKASDAKYHVFGYSVKYLFKSIYI